MLNLNEPGCGVRGHDDACLCDVVIPCETPWINDAVHEMWMGKQLCAIRGHGAPWTDGGILDYLEELRDCHDIWDTAKPVVLFDTETPDDLVTRAQGIRRAALVLLRLDPPMELEKLFEVLNVTCEEFVHVLTLGRKTISWETMRVFEQMTLEQTHKLRDIAKTCGLSEATTRTLYGYWFDNAPSKVMTGAGYPRGFISGEARRLTREGLNPSEVSAKIKHEYNVKLAPFDIARMNKHRSE